MTKPSEKKSNVDSTRVILRRRWNALKSRCYNKNNIEYHNYGGRGIIVQWKSYEDFFNDMSLTYKDGLTLDRKDNNGHYCKENCKWSTLKEQANNRRTNKLITFNNKTLNITQWEQELRVKPHFLKTRLLRGWTVTRTFTQKPRKSPLFLRRSAI